ncbi:Bug family tripartite tricarboxylate transporter substrate binding protein [Paraburkholderia sp. ZP32-5]|uniref:Bug family tripartite tricarboxylate transporter substrate binding protein n=1 Tax=Paraburkholderia sp. ZP32-5 TaxID=2883245 RepID=UPI001F3F57D7|nr:tripartite tricarboxylate transporter substrate binding protein [Paraburkholderia sp. ZP32-5]
MHRLCRALAILLCCAIGAGVITPAPALAEYPDHPIRLILLFPPGGETDPLARAVGQELSKTLNTSVVIENRPGAAGNIAAALVAHAPKDGYTLLWGLGTQLTVNPLLYRDLSFSVDKDFAPISLMAESGFVLVVNPKVPAHSLAELIEYAKQHPGKLNVSTAGVGSPLYLANMLFMARTGTKTVNVTYPGNTALPVLTGEADLVFGSLSSSLGFIRASTVRPLAVTGPSRLAPIPDVPTMTESGVPGYVMTTWHALLAPAGTPQNVIDKLHDGLVKALAAPEIQAYARARGITVAPSTPDQLHERIRTETEMWRKILQNAGVGTLN